jgi:hypothetical protein
VSQAGVNGVGTALMSSTSWKAPETSTVNFLAESTVVIGRVGIDREEVFGPASPSCAVTSVETFINGRR